MKKSIGYLTAVFTIVLLFAATPVKAEDPLIGSWTFSVNQAPWEYSRGKVVFEAGKENVLQGKVLFTSGREIKINKISKEKEKVLFEMVVDGYQVKTIVTLKDDVISGHVETIDGNMPFSAKREVPES